MSNTTVGALAPVKWLDERGGEDTALFVIGANESEIDTACDVIWNKFYGQSWLQTITVVEVTPKEWWDVKHGTNISKGYYINDTSSIELIKQDQ